MKCMVVYLPSKTEKYDDAYSKQLSQLLCKPLE